MKTLSIITVLIAVLLFSCTTNEEKKEATEKKDTVKTDTAVVVDETQPDWTVYEKVYAYEKDGHKQKLGVKWLSETQVEYRFVYEKGDCILSVTGKAGNVNTDMGTEIDEDEEGAYPANEFIEETEQMELAIRIDAENKAKARIIQWVRDNKTCKIDDEVIMKVVE